MFRPTWVRGTKTRKGQQGRWVVNCLVVILKRIKSGRFGPWGRENKNRSMSRNRSSGCSSFGLLLSLLFSSLWRGKSGTVVGQRCWGWGVEAQVRRRSGKHEKFPHRILLRSVSRVTWIISVHPIPRFPVMSLSAGQVSWYNRTCPGRSWTRDD